MPKSVARGSLLGIAGQAWHLLTAFLLYAYLARSLGPTRFGEWRVVLSVLAWFELTANTGLISVVTRSMTERPDDRPRLVRAAYVGQLLTGLVAFGLLLAFAGPIAKALSSDSALAPLIRISALDIPLYSIFMVASSILLGVRKFERQAFAWMVYASAKFVSIAGLVWLGFSVEGALIGNAISSVIGLAAAFMPWEPVKVRLGELVPLIKWMLVGAIPFLALSLLQGLGQSADLWLVSATVPGGVVVGWYAAATVLAEVPVFLVLGLDRALFPSVAGAHAEGDHRLAARYATQGVRLAVLLTALGVAIAAGTGREVLELVYSKAYVGAYVPMVVLMVAALGRVVRSTCTEILMARHQRKPALWILGATVALEIVLLVVATPRFGLLGAASAAAFAALVGAGIETWVLRDMLGWRPNATLARSIAAAAVVGAGLAFASPPIPWLLVAYPLALLVYVGVLALLGEFDRDDLASVRTALGR